MPGLVFGVLYKTLVFEASHHTCMARTPGVDLPDVGGIPDLWVIHIPVP